MKAIIFLMFSASALAQSSSSYTLTATVLDAAGGAQASADYAQQTTLVGIHGIASDATPNVMREGFAGQLYEPVDLQIQPAVVALPEGGSQQFAATLNFDDATTFIVPVTDVAWNVPSGNVASVSSTGLVTAAFVYQDTTSRVGGSYNGFASLADITIRNTGDDNFRPYESDGLSDVWQVGWFGESDPAGRANMDPDGDGQNNAFEYLSGYSPLDGTAFLKLRALSWDGANFAFELSRVRPGIAYTIESSPDLVGWGVRGKLTSEATMEPFTSSVEVEGPSNFLRVRLEKSP